MGSEMCIRDRQESILVHPKRHPMWMDFTMGCDENGIIQGVKASVVSDTGGFASPLTLKNRWYFRVGTDTLPEALHSAKVLEQDTETAFITPPITGTDAERLAAYLPTLAKMRVLD